MTADFEDDFDSSTSANPTADELLKETPPEVIQQAQVMLEAPNLMDRIVADVQAIGVAGEVRLIKQVYVIGTSRLLPEPCGAIVQGASACGKSFTTGTVGKCFPPEAVVMFHSFTPNALVGMEPGSLKNKFVISGERPRQQGSDSADGTKALRELQSDGVLRKAVNVGGKTRLIEQEGPIAFIETTTAVEIFNEDVNRNLLLTADERPEQTQLVLERIAAAKSGAAPTDVEAITQKHWAAQRMLRQRRVFTPYLPRLAKKFGKERIEARRAFPHLCNMIEAVALLHQFQRQLDANGNIIAELSDYEIAADLCREPLARLLGGKISDAAIRFYKRLVTWVNGEFSTTEAKNRDNKTSQAIRDSLQELASIGAVVQTQVGRGSRPAMWQLTNMSPAEVATGGFDLPAVEELVAEETAGGEPAGEEPADNGRPGGEPTGGDRGDGEGEGGEPDGDDLAADELAAA